jgi:hypothetical protein
MCNPKTREVVKFVQTQSKSISKFFMNLSLVFMVTISVLVTVSGGIGRFEPNRDKGLRTEREVEIRLAFSSISPNMDDSVAPIFMVIGKDGRTWALRYLYEGVLPEAEVQRLFARVRAAFRSPEHRKDYDRKLIYESDSFYLGARSDNGKVKEMFGSLETRPEEVRTLITEMTEVWRRLNEVPPAFAYLTSRPIEKDRLRLLKSKYKVDLLPIESLPAALQPLLMPVVTQSLNFYPLTQPQYNQLKAGKLAITFKGKGYELSLFPSAKEAELRK